jgi:hypothetical protein
MRTYLTLFLLVWAFAAGAYPPAPHHLIYGIVRDEMGDPIDVSKAEIILETATGVTLRTAIVPNLRPGVNYELSVPMDAGLTGDSYKPTALKPMVSFRMKVKIGTVTYLPMEMAGGYSKLGQPALQTRIDLTLGEDSDGDGLPDDWERMLLALSAGRLKDLSDVRPDDDFDGDGLGNLQEYLLGTYAFDPQSGFRVDIVGFSAGQPVLEFMVIRGRNYTVHVSSDLQTWQPVEFRLTDVDSEAVSRSSYSATDTRMMRVQAGHTAAPGGQPVFFKAQVR